MRKMMDAAVYIVRFKGTDVLTASQATVTVIWLAPETISFYNQQAALDTTSAYTLESVEGIPQEYLADYYAYSGMHKYNATEFERIESKLSQEMSQSDLAGIMDEENGYEAIKKWLFDNEKIKY